MNGMRENWTNLSHHCRTIKNQKNRNFTCARVIVPSRPIAHCNGTCFHTDLHHHRQYHHHHHPVYSPHFSSCPPNVYPSYCPMPPAIVQSWPGVPLTYNPAFSYPFRRPSCSKTNQKSLDPSTYRITVRRMTPSHTAAAADKQHRNNYSDLIHLGQSNQTIVTNHSQFKPTTTTNPYGKDHLNSNNQNIPSIPSKKIVPKNDGTQVSSTSFITTTDDRKSFTSDEVSERTVEHFMKPALALFELNSVLPLDENRISTDEAIAITNDGMDESITLSNENLIAKEMQSTLNNAVEKHLSIQAQLTIDRVERNSMDEDFLAASYHNESNIDTTITSSSKSVIEKLPADLSQSPQLPSSFPPDINTIKSKEMLVNFSQSSTSLLTEKTNSSTNIRKSSIPLRNTRSTLDFGLIIDETTT